MCYLIGEIRGSFLALYFTTFKKNLKRQKKHSDVHEKSVYTHDQMLVENNIELPMPELRGFSLFVLTSVNFSSFR